MSIVLSDDITLSMMRNGIDGQNGTDGENAVIYTLETDNPARRYAVASKSEGSSKIDTVTYTISPETLKVSFYRINGNTKEAWDPGSVTIRYSTREKSRELTIPTSGKIIDLTLQGVYETLIVPVLKEITNDSSVDIDINGLISFYATINNQKTLIGSFEIKDAQPDEALKHLVTAANIQTSIDNNSMVFDTSGLHLYNGAFDIYKASLNTTNGQPIHNGAELLFKYDSDTESLYIKTNNAQIGNWIVSGGNLQDSSNSIWLAPEGKAITVNTPVTGASVNTRMVFKAGSNFGVDKNGKLYASKAKITGEIEATSLLLSPGVAQSAGLATNTQATDAAKTATNFLQFINGTLTIGDIAILNNSKEAGSYYYTQITNKSFDIGRKRWYIDSTTSTLIPEEKKLVSFGQTIQFYPGDDGTNGGSIDYVNNVEYISSDPHLQLSSRNLIMLGTDSAKLCVGADGLRSISLIEARLDSEGKSFINLKNKRYSSDVYGLEIRGDGVFYCSGSNKFDLSRICSMATIDGNNAFTGKNIFLNGLFEIKANRANDDSWINLSNSDNGAYYAFGIRRPYHLYGLQLKYHPDATNDEESRPGSGTADVYYDIYHTGNYTKIPVATTGVAGVAGLMSAADKTKLDGIATGANNYSLPTANSSTRGGVLLYKAAECTSFTSDDGAITPAAAKKAVGEFVPTLIKPGTNVTISTNSNTKEVTINAKDTTYNMVSTSANGLMYASDKDKLDHIAAGANNYSLPTASSSTLGGVKIGNYISNNTGTISLTKENVIGALGSTPLFLTAAGATRKEDVDFDTLTTPGTYRFPNVGTMDGSTHAPTSAAGYLIVHNIPSTDYVIQEFYHYYGHQFWRRMKDNYNKKDWTTWWEYRSVNYTGAW